MNIKNKIRIARHKILLSIAGAILLIIIIGVFTNLEDGWPGGNIKKTKDVFFDLGNNLVVTQVGSYSGIYMEDASKETVSGVMMLQIKNQGDITLQYAEVTTSGPGGEAQFKLSTVKPGQTVTVLEAGKQKYSKRKCKNVTAKNVAFFQKEPELYEEKFEIQPLDGGLNVTNISGKDIKEEIVIYFKNSKDDMLMGGITYRGRITGGLKSGEIRQLMSENFTKENTKIMFITIDGK